jgi:transposase
MELTVDQRTELESVLRIGYDRSVSARAQMVLWRVDGHGVADIAAMAGMTKPTVYKWIDRFEKGGLAALGSRTSTGHPRSVSGEVRARILVLTKVRHRPRRG